MRHEIGILIRNVCPEIKCIKFVNGIDDGPLQVVFYSSLEIHFTFIQLLEWRIRMHEHRFY